MADYLIVPEAFVKYVSGLKRIPIPPDSHLATLHSMIEIVCLEAAMTDDSAPSTQQPTES